MPWAIAALCGVVAVVYGPTLSSGFIADDLTNLHFVRTHDGLADAWIPGRLFGAPVTQSRYMPLHLAHWWAIDRVFGDAAAAHHVASWLIHTVVALLVGALVRVCAGGTRAQAFATSLLFATMRLHGQSVAWISVQFRLLATGLLLAAVLVAWAPPGRFGARVLGASALFLAGLLANPDLVIGPVAFVAFACARARAGDRARARTLLAVGCIAALGVAAFAWANEVSAARFPDDLRLSAWPQPGRLLAFVTALFVPFELPTWLKLVAVGLLAGLVVRGREPGTWSFLAPVIASAWLWSSASYELAPRYLYVPSTFLTALSVPALARVIPSRARWLAPSAVALAVGVHVAALRFSDLPRFSPLSVLPRQLTAVAANAPGARVFVSPASPLPPADLAFFDRVRFVSTPADATHVVPAGVDPAAPYWDFPWLGSGMRGRD